MPNLTDPSILEVTTLDDADLIHNVDVDDLTDPNGTSKKITAGNLRNYIIIALGTAALENIGTVDGAIPVIGAGNKLDNALLNEATEILAGIKRLATQAEANDTTNDNTVLTPKKLHEAVLGFDLLETLVANNDTSLEFINLPINNYSDFKLIVSGVTPSDNATNFSIRFSNNNGGVWQAANYRYAKTGRTTDGGNATDDDDSDSQIVLNDNGGGNQVGNQATSAYNNDITVYGLDSTTKNKHLAYESSYDTNTANRSAIVSGMGVFFGNTQAVNGIQAFFNAGTFSGIIKLYGIK